MQSSSILPKDVLKTLEHVEAYETPVLKNFLEEVRLIFERRIASNISQKVAELLIKINHGVPNTVRERQKELSLKHRYETLTPAEHEELLKLSEQIRQSDVIRLQALIELAEIREMSLDELMNDLGLKQYNE